MGRVTEWRGSVEQPRLGQRATRRSSGSFWRGAFLIEVGERGGMESASPIDPSVHKKSMYIINVRDIVVNMIATLSGQFVH